MVLVIGYIFDMVVGIEGEDEIMWLVVWKVLL